MATDTISILMPVRNAEATLAETLQSLKAQTRRGFELVVVDDGSTDQTRRILEECWTVSEELVVLEPGEVGLVEALSKGLEACRGEWIVRMDADDIATPNRLEAQWNMSRARPDLAVISSRIRSWKSSPLEELGEGYRVYDTWINRLVEHEDILRERFVESPIPHPSVMFHKEAILGVGGYEERGWPEDYDLWLRCAAAGLRFGKVDEVLLYWRDRDDRTSRTDKRYRQDRFLRCKSHHLARGPLKGINEVVIWGAGPIGRKIGRGLDGEGIRVLAYIDIDPAKIGNHRRGVPVVGADNLKDFGGRVLLSAVGARGARELIRSEAAQAGWVEGDNFWCVA